MARELRSQRSIGSYFTILCVAALALAGCTEPPATETAESSAIAAPGPLEAYVQTPDDVFDYRQMRLIEGDDYVAHVLELTSQTWLTEAEVNRPVWKHWLTIVRPNGALSDAALLYIGGGSNDDPAPEAVNPLLLGPALEARSIVAELQMVPNQPLEFVGDDFGPRWEDNLIAYGWDKFLRGGDAEWLARLPMTKAAVRAIDAVTEYVRDLDEGVGLERFVVAGGSKRGWTTWTTAIADPRVVAIAPIVIDLLNVVPSFEHHWRAYGFYAPAVGDYVREGTMEWLGSKEYRTLLEIVEPYEFRERLTLPKLLINATGDQFFLPDSAQFYFDDLVGERHLRYVPNADHSLGGSDAVVTLTAYFTSIVEEEPRPEFSWTIEDGAIRVTVDPQNPPLEALLWQASNPESRDFRVDTIDRSWTSSDLVVHDEGVVEAPIATPETGWTAYFVELTYPGPGQAPLKLTTEVKVLPEDLPFGPPPEGTMGERIASSE